MAITTMDGLLTALANAQDQKLFFPSATNVAGGWVNLNLAVTGGYGIMAAPAANTAGGTAYNQSTQTTGFPKWTANAGTNTHVGRAGLTLATAGTLHLYDLAYAVSGFSSIVTTAQTITSNAGLPARFSTAAAQNGLEIWLCYSSAVGATAHNITVQYTNTAGTAGRNTVSVAGTVSMPANRMVQLALQSGDTGVQSIQGITFSASSGTAGNVWVVVMKRLFGMACPVPNVGISMDFADLGFPKIADESCLLAVHQATTTSSGIIMGQLDVIQG